MSISGGPDIVENGLVLHLDAADSNSYTGSGTTWTDLTGNGYNGTLTNGPTYSSNNKGCFILDGTDDRVDCGTNFSTYLTGTNSFTIECFIYPQNTQAQYADIWGNHTDNQTGLVCQRHATIVNQYSWNWGTGSVWSPGSGYFSINSLQWNCLCCVRNGSSLLTYLNGILILTATDSSSLAPNTSFNFQIGTGYNLNSARKFKGNISNFRIYSRALSASEVLQNYNATKGRYGL